RALEQRVLSEPNRHEIRHAGAVELDADLRQLGKPDREIELGVPVVRRPALAARLGPCARVDPATEIEAGTEGVFMRGPERISASETEPAQSAEHSGGRGGAQEGKKCQYD